MNKGKILQLAILCSAMSAFSTQAAFIGTGQDSSSPYYCDFYTSSLAVQYTYTSGTGIGEFIITGNTGGNYKSGADAAGTGSLGYGTANPDPFSGSYSFTAWVHYVAADGQYEVFDNAGAGENSTFSINGYLPGISPNPDNTTPSELLLSGNLKTGINTIGYSDTHNLSSTTFDFLYTVSGGDSKILQDFFGANNGQGAMILGTGTLSPHKYNGLAASFANTGAGVADTFVPEPAAYPVVASIFALFSYARTVIPRRKKAEGTEANK